MKKFRVAFSNFDVTEALIRVISKQGKGDGTECAVANQL